MYIKEHKEGRRSSALNTCERNGMPLKLLKHEVGTKLKIEQILYRKRYALILDRSRCWGCDLCNTVCPRQAIELKVQTKEGPQTNTKRVLVDVDPTKCDYCGMCVCICPFGALKVFIDGETSINVEKTESFPHLIKEIRISAELCDPHCTECMDLCPLKINLYMLKRGAIELCPCCRWCQVVCPVEGAIQVRKIFTGTIKIRQEKCPEGCKDCLDACPVNAMFLDDNGKVQANDTVCIYCKACLNVCPKEGAIEIQRTGIHHSPVKSGAWNKALEKLTSTVGLVKELRAKSAMKIEEAALSRFYPKRK